MTLRWHSLCIDCRDFRAQAAWWAQALGWVTAYADDDIITLVPPAAAQKLASTPALQRGPGLDFVNVPEAKTLKNRLHLDLAPLVGEDQEAEVARLVAMGATRVDVGQGEASWVVLADPEGNEFCILTPRAD